MTIKLFFLVDVLLTLFTMLPHAAVTLDAISVRKRADASMGAQALPPMTHPGLTKITHCPLVE